MPVDNHCLALAHSAPGCPVSSVEFVLKESLHLTCQILRLLMIELRNDEFLLMILYMGDDLYGARFRVDSKLALDSTLVFKIT